MLGFFGVLAGEESVHCGCGGCGVRGRGSEIKTAREQREPTEPKPTASADDDGGDPRREEEKLRPSRDLSVVEDAPQAVDANARLREGKTNGLAEL